MDLLRQRAGLAGPGSKGRRVKERDGEDLERAMAERDAAAAATETPAIAGPSSLTSTSGHINLFEDLERVRTSLPLCRVSGEWRMRVDAC